jgi:predicted O-methyltransferase YrrM
VQIVIDHPSPLTVRASLSVQVLSGSLESGILAQTTGWKQANAVRRLYAWRPIRTLWGKCLTVRSYWRRMLEHPSSSLRFLTLDPETTNFTYDISNRGELVSFLSKELSLDAGHVRAMVAEIDADNQLRAELTASLRQRPDRKSVPLFGRRIGWYCIVRLCRPRLVVETGVHDGLGSTLLLAALRRNADDGHNGRLIAIDILQGSGWLVPDRLRTEQFSLVIRPSLDAIADIADPIDLFIHDSDHSESYEAAEYAAVKRLLSPRAIVISDNAHVTSALRDLARNSGWHYAFWKESPADHFYGGAGIGIGVVGKA